MAMSARSGLMFVFCLAAACLITSRSSRARLAEGDCGPRSLYAVARQLGLSQSRESVSSLFIGSNPSANFHQIQKAAQRLGLPAEGRQMTVDELRRARPLGILHVDGNHFVGLVGHERDAVWIADPTYVGEPRRVRWLYADLAGRWNGRILVIERR
jgi:ABC-type bacteriocin/lantibiotic exporter with double-glycine peptidase domain